MTKARSKVLSLLSGAAGPLSASSIVKSVSDCMDQATVYRALHYLEENGYADSFILHCLSHGTERYYTAVPQSGNPIHRHWFHCESCHSFTDLGECLLDSVMRGYEKDHDLTIHTHTLYVTGICRGCKLKGCLS
ncbi:MAG TPA: transcriptional repressor [Treponemataceae bacterium]|nr:transcriptional repressor [Treponemataceae bacterium]HQL04370.1 transcriptional repressor [Treponemataceae bacterium]